MKAIANSTPIISLSVLGKLDLLKGIFTEVFVPKAVYNEVVAKGSDKIGSKELASATWIYVLETTNILSKSSIMLELDEGEAEVITLAKEKSIDTVIIDEFAGRQYASLLGLNVIGTLGILLAAKNKGLVGEIRPLMDVLISHHRYIDQTLYHYFLKLARED
jgi:predicted nucleic acid-binding protein